MAAKVKRQMASVAMRSALTSSRQTSGLLPPNG